MVVVSAFGTLNGTQNAGMCAYYRAVGCDSMTIADALPLLSKIDYYENEYIIGEMLIWDAGEVTDIYNNCVMVRVIIYNDGWICAWFDKITQSQLAVGGAQYIDDYTLEGWGSTFEYENRYNGCFLKITSSTDPDCPVGTVLCIKYTDYINGRIIIHDNLVAIGTFNSGYSYGADIYMNNGNLVWWGRGASVSGQPPYNSNRLYRAIHEIWEGTKYSSNSSNWSPGNATLVYMYDSQTDIYTNETTDFNDTDLDDCQVLPSNEVINDAFYIGHSDKTNGITITMGTPGVGGTVVWEYWDGLAWSTLTCVDGSSGFTATGELTFNPPDDWTETLIETNNYFWIRARVVAASYTVTPLLSQGQLYYQLDNSYNDLEFGIYDFEYTSANYCLISGMIDEVGSNASHSKYCYTTVLPGKTIHDHTMSVSQYEKQYGYSQVYFNGNYIYYHTDRTHGFVIYDLEDYRYDPGIQNVIKSYVDGSDTSGEVSYCSVATVIICN